METDTSRLLRRADRFQVVLIGEGLLIGGIAGFVVLLYRMALEYAGSGLTYILDFAKGHPARMAGWFAVLVILSRVVGKLVTFEPMISGSGIPQLEGEMVGKLTEKWCRQNFWVAFYVFSEDWPSEEKARPSSLEPWWGRRYPEDFSGAGQKKNTC